jgi:hypothetical protein
MNPALAGELDNIYKETLKMWAEQAFRLYTAHGQPHIEQVEQNLDNLTRPLMESAMPLEPEEIYVLLAACCLHDIGMQLDEPDAREKHAQYAYDLILYSSAQIGPEVRRITLPITDTNQRQAIALIARAHWTDFALALDSEDYIFNNRRGRLRLLGTLLALADLLDISPVRARYFRTIHRLYDLNPVSELHQVKHALVKGFQIVTPNPMLRNELQFQLSWHKDDDIVRDMADWIMQWFNSQWRQLSPEIYEMSRGTIGWAKPWAKVAFNAQKGPLPDLKVDALNILKAERAEQRRIDRDLIVARFRGAIQNGETKLFLFSKDPDFDGRELTRWCEADASLQNGCLVARADIQANIPLDLASIVSQLMEQFGRHMAQSSDIDALEELRAFASTTEKPIVSIIITDQYRSDIINRLLRTLALRPDTNPPVARVCLYLSTGARGPKELLGVEIEDFAGSFFTREDVEKHLKTNWGYTDNEACEICDKMSGIGIDREPGKIYNYINWHCGISSLYE